MLQFCYGALWWVVSLIIEKKEDEVQHNSCTNSISSMVDHVTDVGSAPSSKGTSDERRSDAFDSSIYRLPVYREIWSNGIPPGVDVLFLDWIESHRLWHRTYIWNESFSPSPPWWDVRYRWCVRDSVGITPIDRRKRTTYYCMNPPKHSIRSWSNSNRVYIPIDEWNEWSCMYVKLGVVTWMIL